MPRARNIKHSFFVNDELANIPPLGRLLFVGLWTIADREGRLQDKPQKIKVQILPYDKCNVDKLLDQLQEAGFILRYQTDKCPCIQILNFTKHQNPHMKEQGSELPAPDLHHTCTMQTPNEHETSPADSGLLIPDSCNLKEGGKFKPPSIDEIKAYCKERNNGINAEQFHDFYESKNWYIGKNKMKDWKAAVRTWERREVKSPTDYRDMTNDDDLRRDTGY